jgi:aldehyde dehydrogenase (NAD+)
MKKTQIADVLKDLGLKAINPGVSTGTKWIASSGGEITSVSPVDGKVIGSVQGCDEKTFQRVTTLAHSAFLQWRQVPAPKRGEVVRQIGEALRERKESLGMLVSYEMGKSYQEGLGEVQEMIDICDFAVGLSRQLHGLTMHSERPLHRMYEQYHALGVVGIISAFNFPVAVWSWNAMIAWVCGDICIWKLFEKILLCSVVC